MDGSCQHLGQRQQTKDTWVADDERLNPKLGFKSTANMSLKSSKADPSFSQSKIFRSFALLAISLIGIGLILGFQDGSIVPHWNVIMRF